MTVPGTTQPQLGMQQSNQQNLGGVRNNLNNMLQRPRVRRSKFGGNQGFNFGQFTGQQPQQQRQQPRFQQVAPQGGGGQGGGYQGDLLQPGTMPTKTELEPYLGGAGSSLGRAGVVLGAGGGQRDVAAHRRRGQRLRVVRVRVQVESVLRHAVEGDGGGRPGGIAAAAHDLDRLQVGMHHDQGVSRLRPAHIVHHVACDAVASESTHNSPTAVAVGAEG